VRAEEALLAGDDTLGTIAGFTKFEWAAIQSPARYLGNEHGAIHKNWDEAEVRIGGTQRWHFPRNSMCSCAPVYLRASQSVHGYTGTQ